MHRSRRLATLLAGPAAVFLLAGFAPAGFAPAAVAAATRAPTAAVAVAVAAGGAVEQREPPFRLTDQVTDQVGALGGRRGEVDDAVARLQSDTGLQLFVVFVASFDGTPAGDWATQTGRTSGLGDRDALLAVAIEDREYAYVVDDNFPLTDAQLDDVAATRIEPALAAGDWAGAAIGAADGYREAAAARSEPSGGQPSTGSGRAVLLVVGLLVIACALGVLLYARGRGKEKAARLAADPQDPFPGVSTEQLSNRANELLLQVDDALRTSERELGLARGEYGDEETAPFRQAVEEAKAEVAEAFRLRMEIEEQPEPGVKKPAEGQADEIAIRRRLGEIIHRAEAADARLDEQADAFRELRSLESTLEQTVPALAARRAQLAARLPEADAELDRLREQFSGPTLGAVEGNVDEAAQRLRFATAALAQAGQEAASGRRPRAAVQVRAADQALDSTDELLAAVRQGAADLRAAKEAIPALLAEVEGEIATAKAARPSTAELTTAVRSGEQAVATVRSAQAQPTLDPLAELRRLREADAALDKALEAHRDRQVRVERAAAQLDAALAAARAEISAAASFIDTRRGAVGARARALLVEAQRLLAQAEGLATDDPVAALDAARRADQTAEQAVRVAQSDVDRWPGSGGYGGRNAGADGLLGAVLGGILVGGARGSWGGGWAGGWGSPRRRGGGWGGPTRIGGGGFGGGMRGGGMRGGGMRGGGGGFGGRAPGGFGGRGGGGRF